MVWFQCEDCGDNLKKPKLPSHFRVCSANKLSCIDCGQVFGQQSVQGHTQCITETEKYGPKGPGKAPTSTTPNPKSDSKQKPEVDINVGLSQRPPWFCSLCNTSATSRQTLLLHAEGKKHRAKARAFHASKQPPQQAEELTPSTKVSDESNTKDQLVGNQDVVETKKSDPSEVAPALNGAETETLPSSKKRKLDRDTQKTKCDTPGVSGNGKVIQIYTTEREDKECKKMKTKNSVGEDDKPKEGILFAKEVKKKIKWKKLIRLALQSNQGVLKMKKLQKIVQKTLMESEMMQDENQISDMLEQKINSSSKFTVDGKYVRLVAKN